MRTGRKGSFCQARCPRSNSVRPSTYDRVMSDLVIYHHTGCSTSRHAVDEASAAGVDAQVVQYLKTPLDRTALLDLIARLEDPPADLVRKDAFFKGLGLDPADVTTPDAVADLLVEHPRLMQRPVLVRADRAIIGRPKDRVAAFIA